MTVLSRLQLIWTHPLAYEAAEEAKAAQAEALAASGEARRQSIEASHMSEVYFSAGLDLFVPMYCIHSLRQYLFFLLLFFFFFVAK